MTASPRHRSPDLAHAAAIIALAIAMVTAAALFYLLLDILIAFFLGIVIAAALQPWHAKLVSLGVPRGVAVLLIYLLLLSGLLVVGLLVGPVLIEQITAFLSQLPAQYTEFRMTLQSSSTPLFQTLGRRFPAFEALPSSAASLSPALFEGLFGFTAGLLGFLTYFVTVLAVGAYWTLEVPRIERLVLSLTPVRWRAQVLDIWHEIEIKLGAFIRGQALAMLAVALAAGIGFALIGLPNVLALAVLAGLFEAVPLIGPILAGIPAVVVAVPLGLSSVLLVVGWMVFVQILENNVLMPRIMSRTVGISALLGIFAVLAFGTLYGVVGVLVAIPTTAVIQVLLDRVLLNAGLPPERAGAAAAPLERLRARARTLRRQARLRLRGRETRMGIDPDTIDHVVDAVDHEIERAAERVETMIRAAESASAAMATDEHEAIVDELHGATEHMEEAVQQVETVVAQAEANGQAVEGAEADIARVEDADRRKVNRNSDTAPPRHQGTKG